MRSLNRATSPLPQKASTHSIMLKILVPTHLPTHESYWKHKCLWIASMFGLRKKNEFVERIKKCKRSPTACPGEEGIGAHLCLTEICSLTSILSFIGHTWRSRVGTRLVKLHSIAEVFAINQFHSDVAALYMESGTSQRPQLQILQVLLGTFLGRQQRHVRCVLAWEAITCNHGRSFHYSIIILYSAVMLLQEVETRWSWLNMCRWSDTMPYQINHFYSCPCG